jgi:hypothetical protein
MQARRHRRRLPAGRCGFSAKAKQGSKRARDNIEPADLELLHARRMKTSASYDIRLRKFDQFLLTVARI